MFKVAPIFSKRKYYLFLQIYFKNPHSYKKKDISILSLLSPILSISALLNVSTDSPYVTPALWDHESSLEQEIYLWELGYCFITLTNNNNTEHTGSSHCSVYQAELTAITY